MSVEETYKHLKTDKKGLTNVEAAKRLETYGLNELESEPEKSIWARISEQFEDELVIILLVAAVISFIIALTGKQAGLRTILLIYLFRRRRRGSHSLCRAFCDFANFGPKRCCCHMAGLTIRQRIGGIKEHVSCCL